MVQHFLEQIQPHHFNYLSPRSSRSRACSSDSACSNVSTNSYCSVDSTQSISSQCPKKSSALSGESKKKNGRKQTKKNGDKNILMTNTLLSYMSYWFSCFIFFFFQWKVSNLIFKYILIMIPCELCIKKPSSVLTAPVVCLLVLVWLVVDVLLYLS